MGTWSQEAALQVLRIRARTVLTLVLCLAGGWLSGSSMSAQQAVTSATLGGRVEDASAGVLPSVLVTVDDTLRGRNFTARTDSGGRYQFLRLAPADYIIRVEDPRFEKYERRLPLLAGQAVDLPIVLRVAGVGQSLAVIAEAPVLESVRTQIGETVGAHDIGGLPLNGRNFLDLALLAPGVSRTNTGTPQQFAETSAVPGTGISIAGQRNLNNAFIVDGLSANDDAAGLAGSFYSQEVIQQFQVVTSGGNAEFGRASSGVVNIITKSGTNQWHGSAYGILRNPRFDARNSLATRKDPLPQTQYGASAGGPLIRGLPSNFRTS